MWCTHETIWTVYNGSHTHTYKQTHVWIYKVCWDKTLPAYPSCPSSPVDQECPEKNHGKKREIFEHKWTCKAFKDTIRQFKASLSHSVCVFMYSVIIWLIQTHTQVQLEAVSTFRTHTNTHTQISTVTHWPVVGSTWFQNQCIIQTMMLAPVKQCNNSVVMVV